MVLGRRDIYLLFDTVYLLSGDGAQPVALTLAVALVALPLRPRRGRLMRDVGHAEAPHGPPVGGEPSPVGRGVFGHGGHDCRDMCGGRTEGGRLMCVCGFTVLNTLYNQTRTPLDLSVNRLKLRPGYYYFGHNALQLQVNRMLPVFDRVFLGAVHDTAHKRVQYV